MSARPRAGPVSDCLSGVGARVCVPHDIMGDKIYWREMREVVDFLMLSFVRAYCCSNSDPMCCVGCGLRLSTVVYLRCVCFSSHFTC